MCFSAPITEEHAWAIVFECVKCLHSMVESKPRKVFIVTNTKQILLHQEGRVHESTFLIPENCGGDEGQENSVSSKNFFFSLKSSVDFKIQSCSSCQCVKINPYCQNSNNYFSECFFFHNEFWIFTIFFYFLFVFSCQIWNSCFVKTCGKHFYWIYPTNLPQKLIECFKNESKQEVFFCESGDVNDQHGWNYNYLLQL